MNHVRIMNISTSRAKKCPRELFLFEGADVPDLGGPFSGRPSLGGHRLREWRREKKENDSKMKSGGGGKRMKGLVEARKTKDIGDFLPKLTCNFHFTENNHLSAVSDCRQRAACGFGDQR